jgi:hypothetical protein
VEVIVKAGGGAGLLPPPPPQAASITEIMKARIDSATPRYDFIVSPRDCEAVCSGNSIRTRAIDLGCETDGRLDRIAAATTAEMRGLRQTRVVEHGNSEKPIRASGNRRIPPNRDLFPAKGKTLMLVGYGAFTEPEPVIRAAR